MMSGAGGLAAFMRVDRVGFLARDDDEQLDEDTDFRSGIGY